MSFSNIISQAFQKNLKSLSTKQLYILRQKLQGEDEEEVITHEIKARSTEERLAAMQELLAEAQAELDKFRN